MIIRGDQINALQHLDATTGECLKESRERRISLSEGVRAFDTCLRLTTLDGASSDTRSERCGARPGFENVEFICEDHIVCNMLASVSNTC